jgi:hypothetical protein
MRTMGKVKLHLALSTTPRRHVTEHVNVAVMLRAFIPNVPNSYVARYNLRYNFIYKMHVTLNNRFHADPVIISYFFRRK